jgi:hypothetical protein
MALHQLGSALLARRDVTCVRTPQLELKLAPSAPLDMLTTLAHVLFVQITASSAHMSPASPIPSVMLASANPSLLRIRLHHG